MISVLYVDDEPGLLEVGRAFLERHGDLRVDVLDSAAAALERLQERPYDAVVSDYMMPEMDGLAFLRQVRLLHGPLPFILFTGKGREEVVIRALNEGVDFYLQKGGAPGPLFAELGHMVRRAVQRRRADLALEESERRYRDVVETQTEFICRFRPDGTHVFVNEAYCRCFGRPREEIVGRRFVPSLPDEDRDRFCRHLAALSPDRSEAEIEHRVLLPDGRIRWHWRSDRAIFDDAGRAVEFQSVGKDITERRETEDALHESEASFRGIIERSSDLIFIIGEGMSPTFVSPSARSIIGYDPEELVGRPPEFALATIFSHCGRELGMAVQATMSGRPVEDVELNLTRKDGSLVEVSLHAASVIRDGACVGAQVTMWDISADRAAERALVESEEKFRSFVETSPDMIWEIDLDGRFRYISPRVEAILGYTPDEIVGRSISDLSTEQGWPDALRELGAHVASGWPRPPLDMPARHRDGREVILEIRPSLSKTGGTPDGLRGVAVDITERKRTEEALRIANRKLNLLTGITRHDLLNKITVALGYLKLAKDMPGDPALGAVLEKIGSTIATMRSQIEFTEIYQGIGTHAPQWIELDAVLPRSQTPASISLEAEVRGVRVYADPMLEKVFFNLLDNSIRHGERVTECRVSCRLSGEALAIVWEDDGVGVAAGNKERIFESGHGENTGLGMFLVREILSLTGIAIAETGEPGAGARFELLVPKGMWRTGPAGG